MKLNNFRTFIHDLKIAKQDPYFSGNDTTYKYLRKLYKFLSGLIILFLEIILNVRVKFNDFKNGYKILDKLDGTMINNLNKEFLNIPVQPQYTTNETSLKLDENSKPDIEYYKNKKIIRLDFNSLKILENPVISDFVLKFVIKHQNVLNKTFGTEIYLKGVNSWLTFPIPDEKIKHTDYEKMTDIYDAQQWHRDCDNLRDIKIFIYLTDVLNENHGSFKIIKKSNSHIFFNQKNYFNDGFRIKNEIIKKKYVNNEHSFLGEKGTTFLVDTRGFHLGAPIYGNNYRHVLEIYFTNHFFGKDTKYRLSDLNQNNDFWKKNIDINKNLLGGMFK